MTWTKLNWAEIKSSGVRNWNSESGKEYMTEKPACKLGPVCYLKR